MESCKFDLDAYLHRINFSGDVHVSPDTLARLHHAHFHTIPFENFDILLGRGIDLKPKALFKKLVHKKRGGYCFELNGLFLQALQALGFKARALLARVHLTGTPSGRGHQLELISIDGRNWLADVGFGKDSPRMPIPMELDRPVTKDGQTIRLTDGGHFGTMFQAFKDGEWKNLYSFDLGHVFPADIAYGSHYTSTHPDTVFTSSRVAMLPLADGCITLQNRILKITTDGRETVKTLPDGPAYLDELRTHFNIHLEAPYHSLKPLPLEEGNAAVVPQVFSIRKKIKTESINFDNKFSKFSELWSPKIIAEMNDYQFKLVKIKNDFVWHDHIDTDEVFIVLSGEMEIAFRDGKVKISEGEMHVVPKGLEHKPYAKTECKILVIEPRGVVNTGESGGQLRAENDIWI